MHYMNVVIFSSQVQPIIIDVTAELLWHSCLNNMLLQSLPVIITSDYANYYNRAHNSVLFRDNA